MTPAIAADPHPLGPNSTQNQPGTMPTPSPSPPPPTSACWPPTQTHSLLHYLRPSMPSPRFALILVNRPLTHLPPALLEDLWLHAEWRLCADGGANQLFDALAHDPALQRRLIPHVIAGDLDSARPEVLAFYRQLGAKVHGSPCQNSTDLQKCVAHLESIERHLAKESQHDEGRRRPRQLDLVVVGGTDGRFDQTMGVVHALCVIAATGRKVSLLDGHNFLTVLVPTCPGAAAATPGSPAAHRIDLVHPLQGPHCGLLPVGTPTVVSTRGLVWDMDRFLLSFATVISACNQVDPSHAETELPTAWGARWGTKLRPEDVNVTFDELERAMAAAAPAAGKSALGLTRAACSEEEDERVDLTTTISRTTAADAAKAYALSTCSPPAAADHHGSSPGAPGASPPVSPTLLRKAAAAAPAAVADRRGSRSSSVSSLEPVPPVLLEGEWVSTVFVETSQPVVWTVEVDFRGYRSV